jgi:pimeloyl-ACP methyl ester carboxylesterase
MVGWMGRPPDTILLIHGLWLTPHSLQAWAERYERQGLRVVAPAWPGMEGEVDALNRDPSPIAALDVAQVVEHYDRILRAMDRQPIIVGHSFGGTFMQLLLDRGLGAVGVGVASAPVRGVRDLPLSTVRATARALRKPFGAGRAVPLTPEQFRYAFTNTLSPERSAELHRRYHVPASSTVLREGAFANLHRSTPVRVDFANPRRAPMLLIAFGEDHVIPPKVSRHNAERYATPTPTDYTVFPGRPHFPAAPGWEAVADHALAWATGHAIAGARERRRVPRAVAHQSV